MCRSIAHGLVRAGHDITVMCIDFSGDMDQATSQWFEQDGLRVFAIKRKYNRPGYERPFRYLLDNKDIASLIKGLIDQEEPEIVYIHASWEIMDISLVAAQRNIPTVFHVHCFGHLCARQFLMNSDDMVCEGPQNLDKCYRCVQKDFSFPRRLLHNINVSKIGQKFTATLLGKERAASFELHNVLKKFLNYRQVFRESIDAYIVTSDLIRDIEIEYEAEIKRIHVLPHFLPQERLIQAAGSGMKKNKLVLGFFGRISREKGFNLLLEALRRAEIKSPGRYIFHIIVREAGDQLSCEVAKSLGISEDRIHLFSGFSGKALNSLLAALDVCIIPSLCRETGPLTLLESIVQKTPCLCSDAVGMSAYIENDVNGLTFKTGDVEACTAAIEKVLDHPELVEKWRDKLPEILDEKQYMERLIRILTSTVSKI